MDYYGPNGAGKSTTMNMLTGYIEQTSGEIVVDGFDMLKKPKKAKREIGYMPEGVPLYTDLTVREFITYMAEIKKVDRKIRKEQVEKIIEKTGLKDVEKKLIKNLSRGYKQRTGMAGAMVGEPKILILDEPTAGLDVITRNEVLDIIRIYMEEEMRTVIISSHISSDLENLCDDIYMINDGKIILHEDMYKLLDLYGVIKANEEQYENLKSDTNYKNIILCCEKEKYGYKKYNR